jgi:subtilisin family serine protease
VNNAGNRGAGQSVAIIDTGIYANHPYFDNTAGTASRIVAQGCFVNSGSYQSYPCLNGQDTDFSANAADISGASSEIQMTLDHGSHVAGIAAGNMGSVSNPANDLTDGVAPDANIIPLRVFGGASAYDVDIMAAMAWVVSHADQYNIASVNLSLGSDPDYTCNAQTVDGYSSYVTAFSNLIAAGVAPLVASGNDGAGTNNSPWNAVTNPSGLGIGVPACINPAISVASTDYNNVISWFSDVNYGIDLAAPGHWIYSSVPYASDGSGFTYMRGTSMATPVVAGGFALAKAASPNTSITSWLGLMRETGTLVDDVIVQDIPQLNIEAAIGATGQLSAPTNVSAVWPFVHEFALSWDAPTYGPEPTGYRIQYDDVSVDVSASTFLHLGPIKRPDTIVTIYSLDGATVGPSVSTTVLPRSNQTARVARSTSQFIERAYLGGDKCVATVTERVVLQYDSPSLNARTLYILDGQGGSTTVTETRLSPAPAGLTTNYARQIVINSPTTVLKSTSWAYYLDSQGRVGTGYNLANAYSVMQSAPQSPPDVTGISANPGRLSATISWTDPVSSSWRIYVDGVSQGNVANRNVSLALSAGNHRVGVCAVSQTANGEYSSNLSEVSFEQAVSIDHCFGTCKHFSHRTHWDD